MSFVTNMLKWFIQGFSYDPNKYQNNESNNLGQNNPSQIQPKFVQLGTCRECINAFDNTTRVSCTQCKMYTCYDFGKKDEGCVPIRSLWCKINNKIIFDEFLDVRGCNYSYPKK